MTKVGKRNISLKISGNTRNRSSMFERRKYGKPIIIHFYFCSFQGTGKILEHRPKKVLNFEKSSLSICNAQGTMHKVIHSKRYQVAGLPSSSFLSPALATPPSASLSLGSDN